MVVALTNLVKLGECTPIKLFGITLFKYFSKFYPKKSYTFYP